MGRWVKKVKRNKRYHLPMIKQTSHRGVVNSIGNIDSDTEITWHGDRWLLHLVWRSLW